MRYEIKGDSPNQQYLQIRATFSVDSTEVKILFPKWRPGRYELGNFAKNVRSFAVYDQAGGPQNFRKIDTHVWQVSDLRTKEIAVEYSYFAADLNAGSTFLSEDMLYVNPINCLVYVQGRESEKCDLQVHFTGQKKYAGTLPEHNGFIQADSYHDLVDSPFVYCRSLSTNTYVYQGVEFRVSFVGLDNIPWSRVLGDFLKFTISQMDDFGHFPSKTFHFINIITPYPHYHGVEHRASTMIVLGPSHQIFEAYYDELLGISSHELYHVWNVKSIRSVDLWPYDYSRENLSEMGYLCEGITTYLGDYYLMKSGVWSKKKYLEEWEQVIQKHMDNFGRFNSSLAESSFDTWLDGYVTGAPGRKTSIYNEGAIFAFLTDVFIRKNTHGKRSIADLMKQLYERFFLQNRGVSNTDFVSLVDEVSGNSEYGRLFNELIFSRMSFEAHVQDALRELGLTLEYTASSDHVASRLGIKSLLEQGVPKVQAILPGSVADLAGIMLNDKIMAVNNFVIQNDFEQWIRHFQKENLLVLINRQGKLVQIEIPLSEELYFKKAGIKSLPDSEVLANLNW